MSSGPLPETVPCQSCGESTPAAETIITAGDHPLGAYNIVCEGCSLDE